ncbi:MAG: energy transducer TonB [Candidatus Aminicenantaceae bacterium]
MPKKEASRKKYEENEVFKDSFFNYEKSGKRKALALPIAFSIHALLIIAFIVIPLLNPSDLPQIEVYSAFLAPPPPAPPPPPPPPKKRASSERKTRIKAVQKQTSVEPGKLVAPVDIPDEIAAEELSDIGIEGGVVGGVEGGVVGGVLGGVVGGALGGVVGEIEAPVRAIGDIKPPKRIHWVKPVYPELARQAKIEGVVIIEATTDKYGRVNDVKVLKSIPLLDQAAKDAVWQWVYEPMVINGQPRGVIFTVTVRFNLK